MGFKCLLNARHGAPGLAVLPAAGFRRAKAEITSWPGYSPSPLHDLPAIAARTGVGAVHLKDESGRFGLGSFKALGGAYAAADAVLAELARRGVRVSAEDLVAGRGSARDITVTCATDGNHGRSVAWGAKRIGASCCIFVHKAVSQARIGAIAAFGAAIRVVPGTYDDAVRTAAAEAARQGWLVISDTSWPGYTEIPRSVMQGYRVMADEAADQWQGEPPTHVFIQAGVGGVAAAVSVQMRTRLAKAPALIVVEPDRAACLMASAEAGEPRRVGGALDTIMAGLACGEPSLIAWQELERAAHAFVSIPDSAAVEAMRTLTGLGIISGESGAAGLAGLLEATSDEAAREALRLDGESRILLFSTEGATDPVLYARLVAPA